MTVPCPPAREVSPDGAIRFQFVSTQPSRWVYRIEHFASQCLAAYVRNDSCPDFAWTLNHRKYRRLLRASTGLTRAFVSRLAADIRFVSLNGAGEFSCWLWLSHSVPDTVHQEQGRLVTDAALAADL